jgi:hypothetical protein
MAKPKPKATAPKPVALRCRLPRYPAGSGPHPWPLHHKGCPAMTQKRPAAAFAACGRWVGGGAAPDLPFGAAREQHAHSRGRQAVKELVPSPAYRCTRLGSRGRHAGVRGSRAPTVCVCGRRWVLGGARARSHVAVRVGVGLRRRAWHVCAGGKRSDLLSLQCPHFFALAIPQRSSLVRFLS